jgi:hypothetical protein
VQEFITWLVRADQFWSIFGTFLGAVLGIPAGFYVNRWSSKHADRERKEQLFHAIRQAVEHNYALITEIECWINKQGTLFFNVDLTVLDATASLKYELLGDIPLCRKIDRVRFELAHLARKVDLVLEITHDPMKRMPRDIDGVVIADMLLGKLYESMRIHILNIRSELGSLEERLPKWGN